MATSAFKTFAATFRSCEAGVQTLNFYGATCIALFGWAVCRLLDWASAPWLPLWFCAALLIYSADRSRRDPADALNIPRRARAAKRLRKALIVCACASGSVLFLLPAFRGDWITVALVAAGSFFCLSYSIPFLGFRIKDVPLLKTFFAPTVLLGSIIGLPILHGSGFAGGFLLIVTVLYAWCLLFFNMMLCDFRDRAGDSREGVLTLAVLLGEKRTRLFVGGLLAFIELLALTAFALSHEHQKSDWSILIFSTPLYLGWLLHSIRTQRSERFYEWAVEGLLFLPAIACGGSSLLGSR